MTQPDCESFLAFADERPDAANDILERICDAMWTGEDGETLFLGEIVSLDREGANHTVSGRIRHDGSWYAFLIENGNVRGTVVLEWEELDEPAAEHKRPVPKSSRRERINIWL